MAYNQQTKQLQDAQTAGTDYLCCGGSPWDEIFKASNRETTQQNHKEWVNNLNDPSGGYNQPPVDTIETRYVDDSTVLISHGSSDRTPVTPPRRTNLGGKIRRYIQREDKANMPMELKLQEEMISANNSQVAQGASVLTSERLASKNIRKQTYKDPVVTSKTAAVNRAVKELQTLRMYKRSVQQTETSRQKKDVTSEDVRDSDSITRNKCKADKETEEKAKTKAFHMISFGRFKFDRNAGLEIV